MSVPQSVFSNNIFGFTAGGPVRKNKTFFFAGFQENDLHSTNNFPLQLPTADAVTRLRSLFSNNPRLDLYLGALGDLRGTGAPFNVALGRDPQTGMDRGSVPFATAAYVLPAINDGPQWLARIDHYQSKKHRLSWRYTYDSQIILPAIVAAAVTFPGFVQQTSFSHQNFHFSDSYTFGPSYTNEFRFSLWAAGFEQSDHVAWRGRCDRHGNCAGQVPSQYAPNSIRLECGYLRFLLSSRCWRDVRSNEHSSLLRWLALG